MSTTLDKVNQTEIELSGSKYWPKDISIFSHASRYLFRRPEIAFLRARHRLMREDREDNRMTIRIEQVSYYTKQGGAKRRKGDTLGTIIHTVLRNNPEQDVRNFLKELHHRLSSVLPLHPVFEIRVRLRMECRSNNSIGYFTERWI